MKVVLIYGSSLPRYQDTIRLRFSFVFPRELLMSLRSLDTFLDVLGHPLHQNVGDWTSRVQSSASGYISIFSCPLSWILCQQAGPTSNRDINMWSRCLAK